MERLPLHGIRLLDITVVWAGPFASMIFGDLGAEVIRVESVTTPGHMTRGHPNPPPNVISSPRGAYYVDRDPGERPWNRYSYFNFAARQKLAATVDLTKAQGREIMMRLIATSDVLLENNRNSTLKKLGIGYDEVRKVRPDIIYLSAPAYGTTGPYANFKGFGANTEAVVGHTWLRGYPDADPSMTFVVFHSDAAAGASAVFALVAALEHRRRTGEGQFIDMSQAENMIPHLTQAFMDYSMNGRSQTSLGNRDTAMTPQGAYKAKGEDQWIAISIESDAQWAAFCATIGQPSLAKDLRFKTVIARRRNHDELDGIIAAWTQQHDAYKAPATLQAAGITAMPVLKYEEAHYDPHLTERGFYELVAEPDAGVHLHPTRGFRLSETPIHVRSPGPMLGEHNRYVYGHLLGYSAAEMRRFKEEKHIGTRYDAAAMTVGTS